MAFSKSFGHLRSYGYIQTGITFLSTSEAQNKNPNGKTTPFLCCAVFETLFNTNAWVETHADAGGLSTKFLSTIKKQSLPACGMTLSNTSNRYIKMWASIMLVRSLRQYYLQSASCEKWQNELSPYFPLCRGVRQGTFVPAYCLTSILMAPPIF